MRSLSDRVPDHPPGPLGPPSRFGAVDRKPWQRRASPLARYAFVAYLAIVVDASLFPFSGWRDLGLGAFDYLEADWPPKLLPFDLFVNALGYAPLGFLAVLAVHPRVRGAVAVFGATAVASLLSANLEALQTFLPTRVASKLDLLSNAIGALVGAVVAARVAHPLLDTGRLRVWRARWFAPGASNGVVLIGVWFAALVYPDLFVFGTGGLLKAFDPDFSARVATWAGFANNDGVSMNALRFQAAETVVSASALIGAGALLLTLMRDGLRWTTRIALLAAFVATTVAVTIFAHAFLFDAAESWPPLTAGSRAGAAIASGVLLVATVAPRPLRRALAVAALLATVALVNVYPENPYPVAVGLSWTRGRLMNFYGLASGLDLVWPWLAIAYLLRHRAPARRSRVGGPATRSL